VKERELIEKHAVCSFCRNKIGHTGLPLFWRIRVERFGINMRALERQSGLAMMLQSTQIARAMGPDEDMTFAALDVTLTACEACATDLEGVAAQVCYTAMEIADKEPAP
jgi:hypothetical protein